MKILLVLVVFMQSFDEIVNEQSAGATLPAVKGDVLNDVIWIATYKSLESTDLVVYLLCHRNYTQRKLILSKFNHLTKSSLYHDLKSPDNWDTFISRALLMTRVQYAVQELNYAMDGDGTYESTIIYILCSKTNAELEEIKRAYKRRFSRHFLATVVSEVVGEFKNFMGTFLQAKRNESKNVDMKKVKKVAKSIHEARNDNNDDKFLRVLLTLSNEQLREVFKEYKKISGKPIEETIRHHASSYEVKLAYLSFVLFVKDKYLFYAKILHYSMSGLGTHERPVVRIVINHCEIDMVQIKKAFKKKYKYDLGYYIQDDFSGSLRETLLVLIDERKYLNPSENVRLVPYPKMT